MRWSCYVVYFEEMLMRRKPHVHFDYLVNGKIRDSPNFEFQYNNMFHVYKKVRKRKHDLTAFEILCEPNL